MRAHLTSTLEGVNDWQTPLQRVSEERKAQQAQLQGILLTEYTEELYTPLNHAIRVGRREQMGVSHCWERMGAGKAFPSSEEAETRPMHWDDITNKWSASPLNNRKSGKWARPTCQDGVERA